MLEQRRNDIFSTLTLTHSCRDQKYWHMPMEGEKVQLDRAKLAAYVMAEC